MAKMKSLKLGEIKKVSIDCTSKRIRKVRILKTPKSTTPYELWGLTENGWCIICGGSLAECRKEANKSYIF